MRYGLIVAEGVDDLAALREVFPRVLSSSKDLKCGRFPSPEKANTFRWPDAECDVLVAGDKGKIVPRVAQQIKTLATADPPYHMIGFCFDPDTQTDEQVREWLTREFQQQQATLGWAADRCTARCGGCSCELVLLPWDVGAVFDRLAQERNLERAAIEVLARVDKEEGHLVDGWLSALQERKRDVTWKTAFRLWAAIRYAKSDPDTGGAMAQVFGQDEAVRQALDAVLKDSPFLARLRRFAGAAAKST